MEKLIYPLWMHAGDSAGTLRSRLLGPLSAGLLEAGVHWVRVAVVDEAVAPAAGLRQVNSAPPIDALLSLWVDSAVWHGRYEALIAAQVARWHGYLVCESEPIRHVARGDGRRVEGMCQLAFLQRPPRLAYEEWLRIWQGSHTQVAIDTQATFGYRQNVVVRALGPAALPWDAIVEENFPAAAMASQQAFYAAEGDEARYRRHLQTMIESCQRFIDFDRIDVIPASEYNFAA